MVAATILGTHPNQDALDDVFGQKRNKPLKPSTLSGADTAQQWTTLARQLNGA